MTHNERLMAVAEQSIGQLEKAFEDDKQFYRYINQNKEFIGEKMDIKSLKEYASTIKSLADTIRELETQQVMAEPITVIMGEAEKYAN